MNFSSYFNSVLNDTFSFLNLHKNTEIETTLNGVRSLSNSENITLELNNLNENSPVEMIRAKSFDGGILNSESIPHVFANFSGDESVTLKLLKTLSVVVQTDSGNDIIEITSFPVKNILPSSEISTGAGDDFVSITSSTANLNKYIVNTGTGADRILMSGFSNDVILAGMGADVIFSGRGTDYIDGGEGTDLIIFEGGIDEYNIQHNENNEVVISHQDDPENENTIINIEEFSFDSQIYFLTHQQWVQLDGVDLQFHYLNYYSFVYDYETTSVFDDDYFSFSSGNETSGDLETDSLTIDDWSENEDLASALVSELSVYEEDVIETSSNEEPTLYIDPSLTPEMVREEVSNYLAELGVPFDPDKAFDHMMYEKQNGKNPVVGRDGKDLLIGHDGNDYLFGGDGDDVLIGNKGHDFFVGDKGNDVFIGGEGIDTAFFMAMSQDFMIDLEKGIITDKTGRHGQDIFKSVERIMFMDAMYEIKENMRIELIKEDPFDLGKDMGPPSLEVINAHRDAHREMMEEIFGDMPVPPPPPPPPHITPEEMHQKLQEAYQTAMEYQEQILDKPEFA